jgi:hypothetical protein
MRGDVRKDKMAQGFYLPELRSRRRLQIEWATSNPVRSLPSSVFVDFGHHFSQNTFAAYSLVLGHLPTRARQMRYFCDSLGQPIEQTLQNHVACSTQAQIRHASQRPRHYSCRIKSNLMKRFWVQKHGVHQTRMMSLEKISWVVDYCVAREVWADRILLTVP